MSERIVAVAVWKHDRSMYFTARPPARHADVLHQMTETGHGKPFGPQGFMTSGGRWVSREDALIIAIAAKQLRRDPIAPPRLFSEDLW